ncbi:MAG TPA: flagellar basal body L-ring protein FlgH [Bryobacteraceae bacterium]|nr:flagellar basal body L-ring protein FlgH [Bryobacteraceae bacterium]
MKILLVMVMASCAWGADHSSAASAIDEYAFDALYHRQSEADRLKASPGSLYTQGATLANSARDLRASELDDMVTILVSDRASALSKGVTASSRKSSAKYGVGALLGPTKTAGPLSQLAQASGENQLQGQGETSRENNLTTTLTARVTDVLPNGYLVVEGVKNVVVNSEIQVVRVRGVVRSADIAFGNTVRSDRLGNLEVRVDGRGVVGDAVKRPFLLYRILLGLLPF